MKRQGHALPFYVQPEESDSSFRVR